jgi:hypothetical protein
MHFKYLCLISIHLDVDAGGQTDYASADNDYMDLDIFKLVDLPPIVVPPLMLEAL